jgi:hypothetical protein
VPENATKVILLFTQEEVISSVIVEIQGDANAFKAVKILSHRMLGQFYLEDQIDPTDQEDLNLLNLNQEA